MEQTIRSNNQAKKSRKCTFHDVDEYVRKWFIQCKDQGFPISSMMLQRKFDDFANELGHGEDFKDSY